MDVELDVIDGAAVESYRARMQESDTSGNHVVLGIVERTSENTWSFRPAHPLARKADEAHVQLVAHDRHELRHVIAQRFGSIDLPADRLRDDTTARIAYDVFHGVLQLARRTNSLAGFSKSLAHMVAHVVAEDLKPEHENEYRAAFRETVTSTIGNIRDARRVSAAVIAEMQHMFKPHPDTDDDSEEILRH